MTATAAAAPAKAGTASRRPVLVARILNFELVKQFSTWRVRLLMLLSWLGPGVVVFAVDRQSTLPSDTLFGREMHATGWAGSLVVLGVAGTWLLPLLASVIAGDVFSFEDRLGTWRHLLIAVRSHRRIFAAKAIASLTVILLGVAGLAASSVLGGLLAEGNQPLIGLDGHQLSGGRRGRQGPAGLGLRAGADARPGRHRAARVRRPGPIPDGPAPADDRRARDAGGAAAAAAGRGAPGTARLRLHLLERPLRRSPAARAPAHRRRGQPGVGARRDGTGLPAVPAPGLHQRQQRRRRTQSTDFGRPTAGRPAGRDGRHRRRLDRCERLRHRPEQDPAVGGHGVRPPLPAPANSRCASRRSPKRS